MLSPTLLLPMRLVLTLLVTLALAACVDPAPSIPSDPDAADGFAEAGGLPSEARPDSAAVQARVNEATERLSQTPGGQRILAAIEAHGGLAAWYGNGPLAFRYAYRRAEGDPLDTYQAVDAWQSRARHWTAPDSAAQFGWTGEVAWQQPDSADIGTNARFWSLTPYYFVGMPFVLADPGVNHDLTEPVTLDGRRYDTVRVTFDPGTGDAPDDYYVLLLDPETDRVGGVRYVVSYPGFFPEGGSTPETTMLYDGAQSVPGPAGTVVLQEGFRSFVSEPGGLGAPRATGSVTGARFLPDALDALFAMPEGATVQDAM